jgi:glycerophosphoryl diester phosphodiesterase
MTGILFTGMLIDPVAAARAAQADSVRPAYAYWTPELVAQVHAAGLGASSWVVNDEAEMDYVVPMGLDSIGCNYPERLRAYVDRTGRGWRR